MTRFQILEAALLAAQLWAAAPAAGQEQDVLARADRLHQEERHERVISLLGAQIEGIEDETRRAEFHWRLSRAYVNKTVLELFTGLSEEAALEQLSKGEEHGRRTVELCPGCAYGYFWQASNMGKRGQLKGIMNSLFLADDLRDLIEETVRRQPDYPNSYYVLGQLYDQLPGWPVSFGSDDRAVSLGRLSIYLHEQLLEEGALQARYNDYYTELARHLWSRNWSSRRRLREQEDKRERRGDADDSLLEAYLYEGTLRLEEIPDREEAGQILEVVIRRLESVENPNIRQKKDLAKARRVRSHWDR